jgi:hypothetical protein
MAPDVTAAVPLQPYVVRVVFADGEERDVDIEPLLSGPVFGPLRKRSMFEQVQVDELGDTIVWPTGADIDPDVIYGTAPADWPPPIRVWKPEVPTTEVELRMAITERKVVEFRYSGRRRVVHPHAIFVASTGTHCLDAVQVGGRSTSGSLPGWRRFDLNDIGPITVLDDHFDVDPEFEVRARDYRRGILVEAVSP